MDKKLFIANWKSHKTTAQAGEFLDILRSHISKLKLSNKEIIIAPPFTLLMFCSNYIKEHSLPLSLAAQTVSSFPEGAYTGEVSSKQIKEFADYVMVGHSERKRYMHENENDVENKIREAKDVGLKVIQCIQDENNKIFKNTDIIAFEPPNAISTFGVGEPENPDDIKEVFSKIRDQLSKRPMLYGGSVNPDDIATYLKIESCGGFLIGAASLDPDKFISLLSQW